MIFINKKQILSSFISFVLLLGVCFSSATPVLADESPKSPLVIQLIDPNDTSIAEEFGKIYDLPSFKWKLEAAKIAKRLEKAITVTDEGPRADFNDISNIILSSDDLAIIGISDESVQQNNASVDAMLEEVKKLLIMGLDISESNNIIAVIKAAIENAFTNVAYDKESVIGLWTHEEGKQLTYKYNIFYAVKNESTGGLLAIVPMSITIKVDVQKETVGWGLLTLKDINNYSCRIQTLEVIQIPQ